MGRDKVAVRPSNPPGMLPYLGGRWGGQQPDPSPCPQKRHGDRDVRWDAIWVAPPATPICRSHPIAVGRPHHPENRWGPVACNRVILPRLAILVMQIQNGFSWVIPVLLLLPALPPLCLKCKVVTGPKSRNATWGPAATFARAQGATGSSPAGARVSPQPFGCCETRAPPQLSYLRA